MATPVMAEAACSSSEEEDSGGRKVRGRPRLADTDRLRRRLESRKKYDCRRVYLGETHGAWVLRREKGAEPGGEAWTDAKLAAYLLELEAPGKPCKDPLSSSPQRKRRQDGVNNLLSLVSWYCDHKSHCSHEPGLSELSTSQYLYIRAVWQCQAGHRFLQDLHCPIKALHQRACEDGVESDDSSCRFAPLGQCGRHFPDSEQPDHSLYSQPSEDVTEREASCTDDAGTVVCMPMGDAGGGLFDGVTRDALGQVVAAGCPSQVIIIAGPGYEALTAEGIQLDMVDGSSREEATGATLEAVAAFTHTANEDQEEEKGDAAAMTGSR